MVGGEAGEAGRVGAAEAVDGLVGIADDANIAAGRREQLHQAILLLVDVLELVDRNETETRAPARRQCSVGPQCGYWERDEIVEVDRVFRCQRVTIGARRGGNVGGRRRSAALGLGDGAQQALRLALRHDEGFGEQRLALGFPDNAEAGIEPRRARVIAQDRESERVKCVNGDTGGRVRDQLGKPRAHFAGGAARERDREAVRRVDAALGD